jgi:hypothetical protein
MGGMEVQFKTFFNLANRDECLASCPKKEPLLATGKEDG